MSEERDSAAGSGPWDTGTAWFTSTPTRASLHGLCVRVCECAFTHTLSYETGHPPGHALRPQNVPPLE